MEKPYILKRIVNIAEDVESFVMCILRITFAVFVAYSFIIGKIDMNGLLFILPTVLK